MLKNTKAKWVRANKPMAIVAVLSTLLSFSAFCRSIYYCIEGIILGVDLHFYRFLFHNLFFLFLADIAYAIAFKVSEWQLSEWWNYSVFNPWRWKRKWRHYSKKRKCNRLANSSRKSKHGGFISE